MAPDREDKFMEYAAAGRIPQRIRPRRHFFFAVRFCSGQIKDNGHALGIADLRKKKKQPKKRDPGNGLRRTAHGKIAAGIRPAGSENNTGLLTKQAGCNPHQGPVRPAAVFYPVFDHILPPEI